MSPLPHLFAGLALLAPLRAQDAVPPVAAEIPTSASETYPQVTCTSSDAMACADTLQLASDTRDGLAALLGLGADWRFPVHIHVLTPDDPLTAKINREGVQVFAHGDTMRLEAVVPVNDPRAREFVQRQFVTALLWEPFFAQTRKFDPNTKLDVVPLWLSEGLREWLNDDPTRNRESIVRRAMKNGTAPTLAEVTSWHELSTDRLLGLWQRAFCYYLVDSLTREGPRRDDFRQWLGSFATPGGSGQLHFPTEANWQRELAEATTRERTLVYSWDETADEFARDSTLSYAESKSAPVKTCSLDEVASQPRTAALQQAASERATVLTQLELRADPAYHAVLEAYRAALTAFAGNHGAMADKMFAQAGALRDETVASHQKLVDYLNWFEVTHDLGDNASQFQPYFATAKQMDRVQADPAHPNPIRADLLHVESRL